MSKFVNEIDRDDVVWGVGTFVGTYSIFSGMALGPNDAVTPFDGVIYSVGEENKAIHSLQRNERLDLEGQSVGIS
jgi:hypothetical protein